MAKKSIKPFSSGNQNASHTCCNVRAKRNFSLRWNQIIEHCTKWLMQRNPVVGARCKTLHVSVTRCIRMYSHGAFTFGMFHIETKDRRCSVWNGLVWRLMPRCNITRHRVPASNMPLNTSCYTDGETIGPVGSESSKFVVTHIKLLIPEGTQVH